MARFFDQPALNDQAPEVLFVQGNSGESLGDPLNPQEGKLRWHEFEDDRSVPNLPRRRPNDEANSPVVVPHGDAGKGNDGSQARMGHIVLANRQFTALFFRPADPIAMTFRHKTGFVEQLEPGEDLFWVPGKATVAKGNPNPFLSHFIFKRFGHLLRPPIELQGAKPHR